MIAWAAGRRVSLGGICLLVGALLASVPAEATTVRVTATVLDSPPCVINGDRQIEVDFGDDVVTTQVERGIYLQPVRYTLECREATANALRLQIRGGGASFSGTALQTSMADLAILLVSGGKALPVNKWFDFTYPEVPRIDAILVKRPDASLSAGEFTAAATMVVDYQ